MSSWTVCLCQIALPVTFFFQISFRIKEIPGAIDLYPFVFNHFPGGIPKYDSLLLLLQLPFFRFDPDSLFRKIISVPPFTGRSTAACFNVVPPSVDLPPSLLQKISFFVESVPLLIDFHPSVLNPFPGSRFVSPAYTILDPLSFCPCSPTFCRAGKNNTQKQK